MAELYPAQPEPEQVLREGAATLRRPGEGQLLDAGRVGRGCVYWRNYRQAAAPVRAERALPAGVLQAAAVPGRGAAGLVPARHLLAAGGAVLAAAVPEVRAAADEDTAGGAERRAPRLPRRRAQLLQPAVRTGGGAVRAGRIPRGRAAAAARPAGALAPGAPLAAALRRLQPRAGPALLAPRALATHLQARHGADATVIHSLSQRGSTK